VARAVQGSDQVRATTRNLHLVHSSTLIYPLLLITQLRSCRITRRIQLQRNVEGTSRAYYWPVPCGAGRACPLSIGIRRGYPAGEARALLAIRGTAGPRPGAGWARGGQGDDSLGRTHGEAAAGGDDGAHAGGARTARAAAIPLCLSSRLLLACGTPDLTDRLGLD
jgi:hypothetical protein